MISRKTYRGNSEIRPSNGSVTLCMIGSNDDEEMTSRRFNMSFRIPVSVITMWAESITLHLLLAWLAKNGFVPISSCHCIYLVCCMNLVPHSRSVWVSIGSAGKTSFTTDVPANCVGATFLTSVHPMNLGSPKWQRNSVPQKKILIQNLSLSR